MAGGNFEMNATASKKRARQGWVKTKKLSVFGEARFFGAEIFGTTWLE